MKRNKRIQDRIKKLPKDFEIKIIPIKGGGVLLKRIKQKHCFKTIKSMLAQHKK